MGRINESKNKTITNVDEYLHELVLTCPCKFHRTEDNNKYACYTMESEEYGFTFFYILKEERVLKIETGAERKLISLDNHHASAFVEKLERIR